MCSQGDTTCAHNILLGRPPFQIMYNVARDDSAGGTKILDQPTFSSIQPRTRFQLHTDEAARIYFEVKQIGDAAYPLSKHKEAIIPRSQRLLFEQQVLMRPSARFKNQNRVTYCMGDTLTPHDLHNGSKESPRVAAYRRGWLLSLFLSLPLSCRPPACMKELVLRPTS